MVLKKHKKTDRYIKTGISLIVLLIVFVSSVSSVSAIQTSENMDRPVPREDVNSPYLPSNKRMTAEDYDYSLMQPAVADISRQYSRDYMTSNYHMPTSDTYFTDSVKNKGYTPATPGNPWQFITQRTTWSTSYKKTLLDPWQETARAFSSDYLYLDVYYPVMAFTLSFDAPSISNGEEINDVSINIRTHFVHRTLSVSTYHYPFDRDIYAFPIRLLSIDGDLRNEIVTIYPTDPGYENYITEDSVIELQSGPRIMTYTIDITSLFMSGILQPTGDSIEIEIQVMDTSWQYYGKNKLNDPVFYENNPENLDKHIIVGDGMWTLIGGTNVTYDIDEKVISSPVDTNTVKDVVKEVEVPDTGIKTIDNTVDTVETTTKAFAISAANTLSNNTLITGGIIFVSIAVVAQILATKIEKRRKSERFGFDKI